MVLLIINQKEVSMDPNMGSRIDYVVRLYQNICPNRKITPETMIRGTSIQTLCQTSLGPYQRIVKWLEAKNKPNERQSKLF